MRISDWSSDVCSSDLVLVDELGNASGDRVSRDGGAHGLHWHAGGDALTWVNGSRLNRLSVRRSGVGGDDESLRSFDIKLRSRREQAEGVLVLRGGRIITMKGAEIINNGSIVIRNGRITDIGPSSIVDTPQDAIVRDMSRSEEHTSELQSLMRISYAVFCLKKKNKHTH